MMAVRMLVSEESKVSPLAVRYKFKAATKNMFS